MATLTFTGTVRTNKVGSEAHFQFEVEEEDLPDDPQKREEVLDQLGLEALWESGMVHWSYALAKTK